MYAYISLSTTAAKIMEYHYNVIANETDIFQIKQLNLFEGSSLLG